MRPDAQQEFLQCAQKLCNFGPVLNKLMQLKRITEGSRGAKFLAASRLDDFYDFAAKMAP